MSLDFIPGVEGSDSESYFKRLFIVYVFTFISCSSS